MGFLAENEDLVPEEDKFYFGNATVKGLREQLRENGMITSGRKYELYLRLQVNGLRLYTDDRPDDIEDEDDEVSESHEEESDSDEEESEPDEGEEESESDEGEDESESDEEEAGSPDDGDSGEEDDQPGNNQGENDQGGDPPGGGSNNKRRRNDDDDDDDDNDDGDNDDQNQERSQSPPPRKTRRLGTIPVEIQLQILRDLNFAQLWNLIVAFPEGYLGDTVNVFLLDAFRQHVIDYPDAYNCDGDCDGGCSDSSDSEDSDNVRPDDDPDRPLSLLQYVENRVIYDSVFRATQGTYINQLIDTYLQVYGQNHPAVGNENVIEDILWYFRPRPADDSLIHAASRHRPGIVHLLLLRGADVNQQSLQPPTTPLDQAALLLTYDPAGIDGFLTVFALIGAGADVTTLSQASRDQAGSILGYLMSISLHDLRTWTGRWPRVINVQGLSVREFIADARSDYYQRMIPATYALFHGNLDYPNFV